MYELSFDDEPPVQEFHTHNGEWIECSKCRSIMFDTFKSCWSCGIIFTDKTRVAVRL
ncbi:MAG: hypothetical protein KKH41_05245 [Candidatus Thermoplasmatota archaeon]|nr:hypothetical protein [Candidatus Thermoplasmatota archaeon]MBU4143515.1 hypothetical protein [Candidatus Thermoplasmatota archaeon]MBU4591973.1 hypothetical protein [Candidatus Thermoplasmatota archaeon]